MAGALVPVCEALGSDAATFGVIAMLPLALFVAIGLVQTVLELRWPHVLAPYKIQSRVVISGAEYSDAWTCAAVNWGLALLIALAEVLFIFPALQSPSLCAP